MKNEKMQTTTNNKIDQKQYDALAASIIQDAAVNYMNSYRKRYCQKIDPNSLKALRLEREIKIEKNFFMSDRFEMLTIRHIDGEAIIERLQYLAENTNYKTFGRKTRITV